ncbi:MAG: hypothetical protein ABIH37_01880 [archaeon]
MMQKRKKMNKKAWVRIVEVCFAILILMAAVLIIMRGNVQRTDVSDLVYERQRALMDVIVNNESLRSQVLIGNTIGIDNFISTNIPKTWDFTTNICGVSEICNQNTPSDKNTYVSETFVTANLTYFPDEKTRKLMFFVWEK